MPKKKKEEPEIYHTPFDSAIIPPYPEIDLSPYTIETTTLGDSQRRFITTTHPGTSWTYTGSSTGKSQTIYYPPKHWEPYSTTDYEDFMRQIEKEEELKVKIDKIKSSRVGEHIIACQNKEDLSVERVLTTLSAIKGRLMLDIAPVHIQTIECSMTPEVRKNIITAGKKLRMYGKKQPIIATFDEYGNRLPDEIELDTTDGIALKIVDPKDYVPYYLELKAIEIPSSMYTTDRGWVYGLGDDIPF